jgi:hypothetical protein
VFGEGSSLPCEDLRSCSLIARPISLRFFGLSFCPKAGGAARRPELGAGATLVRGAPVAALGAPAPALAGLLACAFPVVAEDVPVGAVATPVAVLATEAAAVTVLVIAGAFDDEPPARWTSAAASTPSESTTTIANVTIGHFQRGDGASRVRAAAPQ